MLKNQPKFIKMVVALARVAFRGAYRMASMAKPNDVVQIMIKYDSYIAFSCVGQDRLA